MGAASWRLPVPNGQDPSMVMATCNKMRASRMQMKSIQSGKEAIQEANGDWVQQEALNRLGTKDGFSFTPYELCHFVYITLFR